MSSYSRPHNGGSPVDLFDAAVIATDTTTVGPSRLLSINAEDLIAISTVSSRTDGTYTVTIQHSPDNVTWYTWKAGSAQSTNAAILIHDITIPNFVYVRASILSASTTTGATVAVQLWHGNKR